MLAGAPLLAKVARPARGPHVHGRQGRRHGGSIAEVFPEAAYQRRTAHFCRNVLARVPKTRRPRVAAMPKAIHAMESREAAEAKALEVASELEKSKLGEAAMVVRDGCAETLTCTRFPRALAEDQDRQRHRAPQPRDSQTHARGRHLPRRQVGPHARGREARVRCGELLGLPALPGRDSAGWVAVPEGGSVRLSESAQES